MVRRAYESLTRFAGGRFATIYLAPHDDHRVHAPRAGYLEAAHYVPGDLFSVNEKTVARVPGLFRRNERLGMHLRTRGGRAALILGACFTMGCNQSASDDPAGAPRTASAANPSTEAIAKAGTYIVTLKCEGEPFPESHRAHLVVGFKA